MQTKESTTIILSKGGSLTIEEGQKIVLYADSGKVSDPLPPKYEIAKVDPEYGGLTSFLARVLSTSRFFSIDDEKTIYPTTLIEKMYTL